MRPRISYNWGEDKKNYKKKIEIERFWACAPVNNINQRTPAQKF
jgi:hypothetical protein